MILPFLLRPVIGFVRPPVIAGNNNYGVGTTGIIIPEYNTLMITIWGAGGGGGGLYGIDDGANIAYGGTGGTSYFSGAAVTFYAFGGTGGGNAGGVSNQGVSGSAGGASGGNNLNTPGGGNSGGASWTYTEENTWYGTSVGGRGGLVRSIFTYGAPGAPVPGTSYTLVCGPGGGGGPGRFANGNAGAGASANIQWS